MGNKLNEYFSAEIERDWINTGWGDDLPNNEEIDRLLEEDQKEFEEFTSLFYGRFPQYQGKVSINIQGSSAKKTFLKQHDLDIFIESPSEIYPDLQNDLETLRKEQRWHKKYVQHPYIYIEKGSRHIDIVPVIVYNREGDIKTKLDRTPAHTKYINENLKSPENVRKMKVLLRSNNVYTSNKCHNGVIGYLLECLLSKYSLQDSINYLIGQEFVEGKPFQDPVDITIFRDLLANTSHRIRARISYILSNLHFLDYWKKTHISTEMWKALTAGKLFLCQEFNFKDHTVLSSQIQLIENRIYRHLKNFGITNISWHIEGKSATMIIEYLLPEVSYIEERSTPPTCNFKSFQNFFWARKRTLNFDQRVIEQITCLKDIEEELITILSSIKTSLNRSKSHYNIPSKEHYESIFQNSKIEWIHDYIEYDKQIRTP